jgi:hypothetical protein
MELLRQACEQIKVELTGAQTANRFLPFVQPSTGGPPPTFTLKRADFEQRLSDLLRSIETCCRRALTEAKSNPTDIQSLLLVGGMSRVPAVRAQIEALFSHRAAGGVDPMRAVALGAALAAAAHDGQIAPFTIDEAAWCVGRNPIDTELASRREEPSDSTAATLAAGPTLPSPAAEPNPVVPAPVEEQRSAPPSSVPIAPDFRSPPVPPPPDAQAASSPAAAEPRSTPFVAPPIAQEHRSTPFNAPPVAPMAPPSAVAEHRSSPFASPPAVHEYHSSPFSAPPPIPSAASEHRSSPFSAPPVELRSSPFSAPPIDYRSSPHASGAPPVSAPPSLTLASVLDHGRFSNPTTPDQVVGLHMSRALTPKDLDPMPLAVFFARILAKKPPTGTLELSSNGSTVSIPMRDGHVLAKQKEYPQLPKAFAWASGEYKFQRTLSGVEGFAKFGLLRFAVDGLRVIVREFDRHPMEEALGPLLPNVPKIRPDRTRVVDTLNEHEQRLVKLNCDGARTGTDVLHHGGAMPGTLLQLLLILTAFDCLEWSAPQMTRVESLQDQLEKRWARVKNANHFDVLGVHWSATSSDVETAYQVWMKDLAPEGQWFKAAPAICRQLRERVDAAYKVLHDPYKRVSHRREAYPDINVEATVDLMSQRAQALGFRAKDRQIEIDARSTRELITELGGTPPVSGRERKDND